MHLQMLARTGHPDFLDLPWHQPLEEWRSERLVEVPRGIHRHVVRFVAYGGSLYALKEMPERLAHREYALLRSLRDEGVPVVEVVGVVGQRSTSPRQRGARRAAGRPDHPPPRLLAAVPDAVRRPAVRAVRIHLLDALAQLLVRLHLVGFFWGDCSLSNTLFRRDAGGLAAYLVDAETGEQHRVLSDGQRLHDLVLAEENIAGDLLDLEAGGLLPEDIDPVETAAEVAARYDRPVVGAHP